MHAMQEDPTGSHGHGHGHYHHHQNGGAGGYGDLTPMPAAKKTGPQIRDTLATACGMLLPLLAQMGHAHAH